MTLIRNIFQMGLLVLFAFSQTLYAQNAQPHEDSIGEEKSTRDFVRELGEITREMTDPLAVQMATEEYLIRNKAEIEAAQKTQNIETIRFLLQNEETLRTIRETAEKEIQERLQQREEMVRILIEQR